MIAAFVVVSVLAADPYSAITAGKPAIPSPLSSLKRGIKEAALLTALKVNADRDVCLVLGVQVQSLCFIPFWEKDDGYSRPTLLFTSLATTRAALRKRWGQPVVFKNSWYWVNPETKLRARLRDTDNPAQLDFETYLPLQDFLGTGQKLAFEHTKILGSTRAELEKAYGITCESDSCGVFFPPSEVDSELLVQVELENGVATKVTFDLPTRDDDARKEQTIRMLEKKWGRRVLLEGEKKDWNFENQPGVLLYLLAGDLTVRMR